MLGDYQFTGSNNGEGSSFEPQKNSSPVPIPIAYSDGNRGLRSTTLDSPRINDLNSAGPNFTMPHQLIPNLNVTPQLTIEDMLSFGPGYGVETTPFQNPMLQNQAVPYVNTNGGVAWSVDSFGIPNLNFAPPTTNINTGYGWPALQLFPNFSLAFTPPNNESIIPTSSAPQGSPRTPLDARLLSYSGSGYDSFVPNLTIPPPQPPTIPHHFPIQHGPQGVMQDLIFAQDLDRQDNVHEDIFEMDGVTGVPEGWENNRNVEIKIRNTAITGRYTFIHICFSQLLQFQHGLCTCVFN